MLKPASIDNCFFLCAHMHHYCNCSRTETYLSMYLKKQQFIHTVNCNRSKRAKLI